MAPQDSTELEVDPLGPVRVWQLTSGVGLIPVSDFHYSSIITAGTIKPEWTTILPLLVIMAACFISILGSPKKVFLPNKCDFHFGKRLMHFYDICFFFSFRDWNGPGTCPAQYSGRWSTSGPLQI